MTFSRLFRAAEPPDGSVPALEAAVTGVGSSLLGVATEGQSAGRRARGADPGNDTIDEALAQKLIHSFLQNRNQTLVPLTLNLRVLEPGQRRVVASALAALLTAGRPAADVESAIPAVRSWFEGLGADERALADLDDALAAPPAIGPIFDQAQAHGLAAYIYVAALASSDARYPASELLADVVQARCDLSVATVRSIARRYRL